MSLEHSPAQQKGPSSRERHRRRALDVSGLGIDPDDRVMPYFTFLKLNDLSRDTGDRMRARGEFEYVETSPGRIGVTVREYKRLRAARTRRAK